MAKVKIKGTKEKRDIGKAVVNAWERAGNAGETEIKGANLDTLVSDLKDILDTQFKGNTDRTIEFDVVFDTDLDATTRLVWLVIPTPDRDKAGGAKDTWLKYWKEEYDDLNEGQKKNFEEAIAGAVLFGCGR
jgi:hypothetical protein